MCFAPKVKILDIAILEFFNRIGSKQKFAAVTSNVSFGAKKTFRVSAYSIVSQPLVLFRQMRLQVVFSRFSSDRISPQLRT